MDWRVNFSKHVYERGTDYEREHRVLDFQVVDDTLVGHVRGIEGTYITAIKLIGNQKLSDEMVCNCRFASRGINCKHMAALGIAYNNKAFEDKYAKMTLTELVDAASEEDLRQFVLRILQTNEEDYYRFKRMLTKRLNEGDISRYEAKLNHILEDHTDEGGFIDYYETYACMGEYRKVYEQTMKSLIDHKQFMDAFDFTGHAMTAVSRAEMDDRESSRRDFLGQCLRMWNRLYDVMSEEEHKQVLQWCHEYRKRFIAYDKTLFIEFLNTHYARDELIAAKLEQYITA